MEKRKWISNGTLMNAIGIGSIQVEEKTAKGRPERMEPSSSFAHFAAKK